MDKNNYRLQILTGCLILLVAVLFSVRPDRGANMREKASIVYSFDQEQPTLGAQSYLVKIAGEETYLLKQREWKKMAPASITKLLTAVLAEETLNPFEKITVSEEAKKIEAKISQVIKGEQLTKDDLIKLALSGSANDIALVLAEEMGRSIFFHQLAKEKIAEIGMNDSSFQNPVGLDEPEHYTTAQDLAKLAEYILYKHPRLWDFSVIPEVEVYTERGNKYVITNTNNLLREFPSILGSKTGFTEKARDTLLMLYPVRPDKIAVVILLKSENRTEDGRKILKWLDNITLKKDAGN